MSNIYLIKKIDSDRKKLRLVINCFEGITKYHRIQRTVRLSGGDWRIFLVAAFSISQIVQLFNL